MIFRDKFQCRPRGFFSLRVFENGVLSERFDGPNIVVDGSRAVLSRLLGGTVANNSVTQIGYGSNSSAPALGNAFLTSAYMKALDSISFPVAGTVSFAFSLGAGESNGLAISEFGLLTAGGTLIARRVRAAPLPKTSSISLSGVWQIVF